MTTAKNYNVDLVQNTDEMGRVFGYVFGDRGGIFFTWLPTLDETISSLAADPMGGMGGLDGRRVADYLRSYLPTTDMGRSLWGRRETAAEIGRKIGAAIARDVLAEGMPREWTGIEDQDADQATAAGLEPDTDEWAAMERAAEEEYRRRIGDAD